MLALLLKFKIFEWPYCASGRSPRSRFTQVSSLLMLIGDRPIIFYLMDLLEGVELSNLMTNPVIDFCGNFGEVDIIIVKQGVNPPD